MIIKEVLRWIVIIACYSILAWVAFLAFQGFVEAEPTDDSDVTYPY
jgi:hypothetical protein